MKQFPDGTLEGTPEELAAYAEFLQKIKKRGGTTPDPSPVSPLPGEPGKLPSSPPSIPWGIPSSPPIRKTLCSMCEAKWQRGGR